MMHTTKHVPSNAAASGAPETRGLVMNMGWRYDLMVAAFDVLLFRGRLRAIARFALDQAKVKPGEAVLDVGCGTGRLVLLAQERVGANGRVVGIDPGPRQIERARAKARRANAPVEFRTGVIEKLDFADDSFDVVCSTLMMHHLPDDVKRHGLLEIARVLRPGGRLVVVDFKRAEREGERKNVGAGRVGIQDLPELLRDTGFDDVTTGDYKAPRFPGMHRMGWVRGEQR